jgi:type II secretory pathway pseudopilin PulG
MKKAFTMIELVFIVVVIGILATTIMPNTQTRSPLQEAAIQLASHIRYTQHLAMIDDKYDISRLDGNGKIIWYKDRWQLVFSSSAYTGGANVWAYTIFSDKIDNGSVSGGDAEEDEIARNPENSNKIMTGGYSATNALDYLDDDFKGMKKLNLGKSYGVSSVVLSGGCSDSRIAFDHFGRPMKGDHDTITSPYNMSNTYSVNDQRLITSACSIELSDGVDNVEIIISPETGYTTISF